jgi:hypothetical protein
MPMQRTKSNVRLQGVSNGEYLNNPGPHLKLLSFATNTHWQLAHGRIFRWSLALRRSCRKAATSSDGRTRTVVGHGGTSVDLNFYLLRTTFSHARLSDLWKQVDIPVNARSSAIFTIWFTSPSHRGGHQR